MPKHVVLAWCVLLLVWVDLCLYVTAAPSEQSVVPLDVVTLFQDVTSSLGGAAAEPKDVADAFRAEFVALGPDASYYLQHLVELRMLDLQRSLSDAERKQHLIELRILDLQHSLDDAERMQQVIERWNQKPYSILSEF
jgi:hypothetical protein